MKMSVNEPHNSAAEPHVIGESCLSFTTLLRLLSLAFTDYKILKIKRMKRWTKTNTAYNYMKNKIHQNVIFIADGLSVLFYPYFTKKHNVTL